MISKMIQPSRMYDSSFLTYNSKMAVGLTHVCENTFISCSVNWYNYYVGVKEFNYSFFI